MVSTTKRPNVIKPLLLTREQAVFLSDELRLLIMGTPTSHWRNVLTEINLVLLEAMHEK